MVTYVLLIETFGSKYTTKEQLIQIFKQTDIAVVFIDEIRSIEKKLVQDVKIDESLKGNKELVDIYSYKNELLEARKKIKELEDKVKHLESKE